MDSQYLYVVFQENPNIFSVGDELKLFSEKFPEKIV